MGLKFQGGMIFCFVFKLSYLFQHNKNYHKHWYIDGKNIELSSQKIGISSLPFEQFV